VREHRFDDEVEVRSLEQMRDVADRARREVVEGEDLPPVREERLREVRSDEAGPAGDERLALGCE
jgi:hypothetical protein